MLESALDRAGVRDRFDLRYNVPFAEMRALLEASRIAFLLYPGDANYAARIPIRIFEYMACGYRSWAATCRRRPSSPAGSAWPSWSRRDPRRSPPRCGSCSATRQRQEEMSRRGPEVARERYNWELEAEKLVALYRELAGSGPERARQRLVEPERRPPAEHGLGPRRGVAEAA